MSEFIATEMRNDYLIKKIANMMIFKRINKINKSYRRRI